MENHQGGLVRARVLVDCEHGKCDDVVEIHADLLEGLAGVVDAHPGAVAYAESLAASCGEGAPSVAEILAAREELVARQRMLDADAEELRNRAADNLTEADRLDSLRSELEAETKRLSDESAQLASDKAAFEATKAATPAPATSKVKVTTSAT